jgi:hypothetical protein
LAIELVDAGWAMKPGNPLGLNLQTSQNLNTKLPAAGKN